ncbi:MAG TPA: cob(I)yrinic acid a,c-diamide adenosyltransferase [Candidatus Cloacimonetes bacterium]|nr:cob(I)yrinic acid a,c-diamide adenosyltransferase [Candidatus Cloacimonadota bacterium]
MNMIHIYTGNGKGKTTASLGLIIRALGNKKKVCLIQFMKKNYVYGEIKFLEKQQNIDIFQFGTDQLIDPNNPDEIDFIEAEAGYEKAKEVLKSGKYDLIVIDEINVAVEWKLLPLEKQLELLNIKTDAEVVMTGRYAREEVIDKADLVTEMKEVKHYFSKGVQARKGVEF